MKVGRYRVLEHLGRGASADVYLAEDTVMHRKVALKLLRVRDAEPGQLQRFEREAHCASLVNHPNVVTVFDVGVDAGVHYIASEYIEGETLRQRLAHGPLAASEAVGIAVGVTSALVAAHEAWIVHRDVKPENIMLRRDRGVKVLDFGVATLAGGGESTDPLRRPGSLVGTLHYLSPEQVRGEPIIDTRSDIYSVGVVLYEMLAGYPPFDGATPLDVLAAIVEGEPPPLPGSIPLALHTITEKAMRKSIYDRWQTASELSERLFELQLDLMMRERGIQFAD
ncbi:MAG TPA: serine/threonine-protein kinase [Thermoanaerobaculia bacterium]|nr:serine/threonine-protein kinase [Thermoanaerobaculia bacterium]